MREEVRWFAERMEEVLRGNDHRSGWGNVEVLDLFWMLQDEVRELEAALWYGKGDVVKECCDVANFAMMIADKEKNNEKIVDGGKEEV